LGGDFELVYTNRVGIYRYKKCLERALPVFDCEVETTPHKILDRVRTDSFDPAKTLLLEQSPETLPAGNALKDTDTNASVKIMSYQPDEVKIEAHMPRPGFLLLLDTYFPGWTATVNGENVPVYRADYDFRAVSLPAGKETVCFSYRPRSLRIGIGLSAASLLVLGAILFWPQKKHRNDRSISLP
jgi:uncharacterized membrane protein YfhO